MRSTLCISLDEDDSAPGDVNRCSWVTDLRPCPGEAFRRENIGKIVSCLPLHLNFSSRNESILRFCALFGDSHLAPDVSMGCAWRYALSHRRLQSQMNGFLAKCLREIEERFFQPGVLEASRRFDYVLPRIVCTSRKFNLIPVPAKISTPSQLNARLTRGIGVESSFVSLAE